MGKLPGDYIAGFVDGEGCFALKFRRDIRRERKGSPEYFYWDIGFIISLRSDDREILEKIKETLQCGNVIVNRRGMAQYSVSKLDDLALKVVPFFEKYQLRAKKQHDFILWKESLVLLEKNRGKKTGLSTTENSRGKRSKEWNSSDLQRLIHIHEEMGRYKSLRGSEWKWASRMTAKQSDRK
ncbi:MAG: LAGLIDADG family homing endonuclease [Candidatus Jorgensenbacteria bacterium]|nr:LAGLIDADG family homing endonuclease [Candidatus Jorgensenbacteria bacterium]